MVIFLARKPQRFRSLIYTVLSYCMISYSMIALYTRDHKDLGFSGQNLIPKPASQYRHGVLAVLVR